MSLFLTQYSTGNGRAVDLSRSKDNVSRSEQYREGVCNPFLSLEANIRQQYSKTMVLAPGPEGTNPPFVTASVVKRLSPQGPLLRTLPNVGSENLKTTKGNPLKGFGSPSLASMTGH